MRISNEWKNYECLDAGNGEKLERWGNVLLRRPEPLAMWPIEMDDAKFFKKLDKLITASYKNNNDIKEKVATIVDTYTIDKGSNQNEK